MKALTNECTEASQKLEEAEGLRMFEKKEFEKRIKEV